METAELFNSKLKVYPDGTIVATFADKPKFKMPDCDIKKEKSFVIDKNMMKWRYDTLFKSDISYDNGYIYIDDWSGELIYYTHLMSEDKRCFTDRNISTDVRADNCKRALDKIYDLVALNDWEYFFTGTLGDTVFDPTNAKAALRPLQDWLKNMTKRYSLKYVLVAEYQPKSGRIHFHGFINNALKMVDSGTRIVPWYSRPVKIETICRKGYNPADYSDRIVYNCPQWKFGFTTAIKAYNGSQACARYITKYITKESKSIFGRYYWSSRNLRRTPDIYVSNFDYDSIYTREYGVPRTKDHYKYYTFFSGEDGFFWELPDGEFARVADYKTAAENSAAIYDMLSDFEEIDTFSDFEIIGG